MSSAMKRSLLYSVNDKTIPSMISEKSQPQTTSFIFLPLLALIHTSQDFLGMKLNWLLLEPRIFNLWVVPALVRLLCLIESTTGHILSGDSFAIAKT